MRGEASQRVLYTKKSANDQFLPSGFFEYPQKLVISAKKNTVFLFSTPNPQKHHETSTFSPQKAQNPISDTLQHLFPSFLSKMAKWQDGWPKPGIVGPGHVTNPSNLIGWQTLSSAQRVERQLSFLRLQQIGTLVEFQVWCWKSLKIRKTPLETSKWAQIPDLSRKHPCFDRKFSYQAQKLEIFRNYRSFHRGRGGYPRRRRRSSILLLPFKPTIRFTWFDRHLTYSKVSIISLL